MLRNLLYVVVLFSFGECIECPAKYTSINDGCFLVINGLTGSWAGSLDLCINTGGYLANINSCSLLGDLVRYFHINDLEAPTGYWINATDEDNEGNWTRSDGEEVPMGSPFWGWNSLDGANWINEPNGGINENCAMLLASDRYRFHDENCGKSGSPLCQADPLVLDNFGEADFKGSKALNEDYNNNEEDYYDMDDDPDDDFDSDKVEECPEGFEESSTACFHFDYNRRVTWNQAYTLCRDQYNSHLAILDSCDLFQEVLTLIRNNETYDLATNTLYWLGGSDNNQEGHWYWINLEPMAMGPPFWGVTGDGRLEPRGNTSQNCANLYKNDQYYFHDTQCELGGYSLCQRVKNRNN